MRESEFIKLVCDYLELNGFIVFPQNSRVPHGNTRYRRGTPDIIACDPDGYFLGIEIKVGKNQLTKSQIKMKEHFIENKLMQHYMVIYPDTFPDCIDEFLLESPGFDNSCDRI